MTARSDVPHLHLADIRGEHVADDRGDDRARRLDGAHRAEPVCAPDQDVDDVRESLDVVDERRIRAGVAGRRAGLVVVGLPAELGGRREQAVQVWREPTRQRLVALDHLEHRLLLAEQVLVRAGHDGHLAVATEVSGLELLHRSRHRIDLAPEACLQADEGLRGADGERGDRHALDQLIRVGSQQGAVLERARLALGAVADQVPRPAGLGGRHPPTSGRWGSLRLPDRAAPIATRCRSFPQGPVRGHGGSRATDVARQIRVERIDRLRRQQEDAHPSAILPTRPAHSETDTVVTATPRGYHYFCPPLEKKGGVNHTLIVTVHDRTKECVSTFERSSERCVTTAGAGGRVRPRNWPTSTCGSKN
jgi:hypothetical protein